jgi:glycosyltransferase involved in cell wall biosynthesis
MSFEISVIVPAYNRGTLIRPTLDSIFQQSYAPAEVVVVDDGSTDDTEAVVAEYGRGVKYVRIENSGPPRARNVGVAATTAPWLAFCDSDDLWHQEKLRLQVRLFQKAPDVEYSFTNSMLVIDDHWVGPTKFDSLPDGYWDIAQRRIEDGLIVVEESMFERLLLRQPIFPSSVMMKRSFFEEVGGWREVLGRNPAEDVEFHLRCVERGNVGVVVDPMTGIRKHDSNFSGDSLRTRLGQIEMLRFVSDNHPVAINYSTLLKKKIIDATCYAADGAFAFGNMAMVRELLKEVPLQQRSPKLRMKGVIAHFPNGISSLLGMLTTAFMREVRNWTNRERI